MSPKRKVGPSILAEYNSEYDGSEVAPIWLQGAAGTFNTGGLTGYGGVVVDFGRAMATDRNIILDPPTFTSFEFILVCAVNSALFSYSAYLVDDSAPENFSNTNLPSTMIAAGDVIELADEVPHAMMVAGEELSITVDLDDLYPVYRTSNWNGKLAFLFRAHNIPAPVINFFWRGFTEVTLPITRVGGPEIAFVAGLSGYDVHAQSRVDRCDRCGSYDLRERFTDDGYSKGLSVCGDCWDPEDPPTRPIPPDLPPIND